MTKFFIFLLSFSLVLSCRSTRKIQTAISKKDSVAVTDNGHNDTLRMIYSTLERMNMNHINFQTFTAKLKVDYKGGDGKSYDVNANIRMYKDSAIWISANAILGIEALRVYITRDSVKLLNKLNKKYTLRSVDYLKDVTALPLDLETLQDLIIGNTVFLDTNIVSYASNNNEISLLSVGEWFKNLLTVAESDMTMRHSKLDDRDMSRNRTADLTYGDYETKKGFPFSTERRIIVTEKNRLDIKLEFKQYDFNQEVSFPFSIPKNYERD